MKIWIASDHAGYERKNEIISYLKENEIKYTDCGTRDTTPVDYPDYAIQVGEQVRNHQDGFGILICGTGIGMSIACNKVKGIRCAKVMNVEEASLTRLHNDANVLALSSKSSKEDTIKMVETFLNTPFSQEERHARRIQKIEAYEGSNDN